MEAISWFLLYMFFFCCGLITQYGLRWSPWAILMISFLTVLLLPPLWVLGLLAGWWISCAFFTSRSTDPIRTAEGGADFTWFSVCTSAFLAFCGYLLTVLFLWRIKTHCAISPQNVELFGWVLLLLIEVCIYKIIAGYCPALYRKYLGLGMTALVFLMMLYSIASLSLMGKVLILIGLLNVNLILLLIVDRPILSRQTSLRKLR